MKKKVGIVTWYHSDNYGSQLQAFALTRILKKLGYSPALITPSNHPIIKRIIETILFGSKVFRKILLAFVSDQKELFVKQYLREDYFDINNPSFVNYNSIVCGSDQIWAPNQYNPYYMLSFVPDNLNKISYAASIGLEDIPDNLVEGYKQYVGRINHVSVREERGRELLHEKCGIESKVVLDPTLLLEKNEWDKIKKPVPIGSDYIFCYFLRKDHKYTELVKRYSEETGYVIYGVSDKESDCTWMNMLSHSQVGSCEFIGLIEGAKAVITDSYHGTIFSLLYHKDFILFERFTSDETLCQNSRINQLKKYFGIDQNIVKSNAVSTLDFVHVNYDIFEKNLYKLRQNSLEFLKLSLAY